MSVKIMSAVFKNTALQPSPKLVLLSIADCANDEGIAYPSIGTLAAKCSLTERGVQRWLSKLRSAGYITVGFRKSVRDTNVFELQLSAIETNVPLDGDAADTSCGDTAVTSIPDSRGDASVTSALVPDGDASVTSLDSRGDASVTSEVTPVVHRGDASVTQTIRTIREPSVSSSGLSPDASNLASPDRADPNGDRTPDADPPNGKVKIPKYKFEPEDMKLAEWMAKRVRVVMPSQRIPDKLNAWANEIRLMRELDGHSLHEITTVFDFANKHHFWYKNILSPDKLRKQYGRLVGERDTAPLSVQRSNPRVVHEGGLVL